ncbi:MAG: hypothetical protein GF311_22855 [Candidatus Lokiarchaeota archaeon]|nr:hypothetical protein [Candidatus Lokiarchaeota archaeon]
MPLWNLSGSREAKTINHEEFKKAIITFFEISGYRLYSNSSIQGCLTDLVFKNPELYKDDIETHVEVKSGTFSINNDRDLREFKDYFLLYLRTNESKRFKFFIMARNVSNMPLHKKIFEKLERDAINDKIKDIEEVLEEKELEFFRNISENEKYNFFYDTTLVKASIYDILLNIGKKTGEIPFQIDDPFLRYSQLEKKRGIEEERDLIISNMKKINIEYFWSSPTDYITEKEIKDALEHPPPFVLYNGKIISIYPFKDYNLLSQIIIKSDIKKIKIKNWLKDKDKRRIVINLLNRTYQKFCELIGLFKKRKEYIYYFPDVFEEKEVSVKWTQFEPNLDKKFEKRTNLRRIFKKYYEKSKFPSFLHIAVNIETIYYDKDLYFTYIPKKVFTKDGINLVPSWKAKKRDEDLKKRNYSYNRNLLLEQLFWAFTLFLSPNLKIKRIGKLQDVLNDKFLHISKILKLIGENYFTLFELDKKPSISN